MRLKSLSILFVCLMNTFSFAHAGNLKCYVNIHQKSGGVVSFAFDDKPVVTMSGNNVVMTTTKTTVEYPVSNVEKMTVEKKEETTTILASSIALNESAVTLKEGETTALTISFTPSNVTSKEVAWTSSNTTVATVNNSGVVSAIKAGTLTITAKTTDGSNLSATCQVTVKIKGVELADASPYTNTQRTTHDALIYTRNFKNTNWQPLYVPFSMSYEDWASQGVEVARINGFYEYDDDENGTIDRSALEVLKVKNGELRPNHPYMVRATTTGEKKITINNATLYPTELNTIDCSTVETKYTFTGTYSAIANAELTAMGAYVMGGGALGQSTSNLNPMRWYMVRESRGGQLLPALKSIKVYVYGEDEADAIDFTYDNEAESEAYNLMGQKVSNSQKGIVIRNGKKFVNK